MPSGPGERYDFFLSRRGSVATIAREVRDVLTEKGYKVLVQDYDIPHGANFVAAMHDALKRCRNFIALLSEDYDDAPFTSAEPAALEAPLSGSGARDGGWPAHRARAPRRARVADRDLDRGVTGSRARV